VGSKILILLPTPRRRLTTTDRRWAHDKHEMLNSKFRIRVRQRENQAQESLGPW